MSEHARRVLLVEPPFYRLYKETYSLARFPLGLGYLAGAILNRRPTWEVKVYNADFAPTDEVRDAAYLAGPGFARYLSAIREPGSPIWKEVRDTIRAQRPSVVGISAKSQNYASACIVAQIAKSLASDTVVVVGGPHPSLARAEMLNHPAIDIAVFGEGEETLVDILDAIERGRPLSSVRGIAYREGAAIVETPPREPIRDLDSLPFPVCVAPRTLLDYPRYPRQAFKHVFAIRGCPYNCSFCGSRTIWGRKPRFRSVSNIVAEIQEIRCLGINYVHFDDDTFGVKKVFVRALCQALRRACSGLHWSCEMHARLVDDETIALMKSAGCRLIQLGVESGNDEMLGRIGKGITVEEALTAARTIKRHGIYLHTFFIVGFPHETEATLNDTIAAIHAFPSDSVIYSIFTPYVGTELFEHCRQQGTIPPDFDFALYNHQSPENYFCPSIPQDVFRAHLRELEKTVDEINGRRKLRMYLSREGYLELRERGLRRSVARFSHFCRNAMPRWGRSDGT